jgi:hypothetical protein
VRCLNKHSTAPDQFTSLARLYTKVLHPPCYLFMAALSHSISLSEAQAQPPSYLLISSVSVSEAQSTLDWLTKNPSDVLFAFPDAPTLTPISKIVSTPDAYSNESKVVSNRPSGRDISPSTLKLRRASPTLHKLLRLL